ncbi:alpha/beta fold hydrolase [Oryzifoliimicrobium ureilyticus]|uniref:alpha/beta fold hydrolase n=1 Tax=Oryzifoliimicrobium ureilyticus TaxID=3113724 RepID=UPI00307635D8
MSLQPGEYGAFLNGVEINYTVEGKGPLLFAVASGWGVGSGHIRKGLEPLTANFTLVCVTPRGSGRSSRPADETAMGSSTMADDLDHLRRHLGLGQIDLFGHSNGAAIALSYAARYPRHCRKLVLADSQLIGFSAHQATMDILERRKGDPRFTKALELMPGRASLACDDKAVTDFLIATFPLYFFRPEKNMAKTVETFDLPIESWAAFKQRAADSEPSATQLHLPPLVEAETLILVGREDLQCPVETSERIASGISNAKLIILEECGHIPWAEQPDIFFSEIRDFLSSSHCP